MLPAWGDGFPKSVFSPDGNKLYYLVQKGPQRGFGGGELWVSDLRSGTNEPVLMGLTLNSFDISIDGRQVVFSSIGDNGKSRIWLAPLNRRTSPKMLPPEEGLGPVFGGSNEVYFRGPEGDQWYIFELKLDTGQNRKFITEPAVNAPMASPDGQWIISRVPVEGQDTSAVVKAYPRKGGKPVLVCAGCFTMWSRDSRSLFLLTAPGNFSGGGRTFIIPLPKGRSLPPLPLSGLNSDADVLRLPGVRVLNEVNLFPGISESTYAFEKQFVQRNLYRIRIP